MRVMQRLVSVFLVAGISAVPAAVLGSPGEASREFRKSDDKSVCVLIPKQTSRIQVTPTRLELTGLPKDSILNYQYIVDDGSPSRAMFPSQDMQKAGAIWLDGDVLKSIVDSRRLQVRVLDRWHEAITEDVSLVGLRDLYQNFDESCQSSN